jgi:hypothetical protein
MRCDGHDPIDPTEPEPEPAAEAEEPAPLDAAESAWDPWLWALYLREVAAKRPPSLH